MQKLFQLVGLVAISAALSACVSSDIERAGVGAAAGAATAIVLDGNIATGAVVGAAGGALCDDVGICRR